VLACTLLLGLVALPAWAQDSDCDAADFARTLQAVPASHGLPADARAAWLSRAAIAGRVRRPTRTSVCTIRVTPRCA
jgi:hypothetical protein